MDETLRKLIEEAFTMTTEARKPNEFKDAETAFKKAMRVINAEFTTLTALAEAAVKLSDAIEHRDTADGLGQFHVEGQVSIANFLDEVHEYRILVGELPA